MVSKVASNYGLSTDFPTLKPIFPHISVFAIGKEEKGTQHSTTAFKET